MEREDAWPYLQQLAPCYCPEPDESLPIYLIFILKLSFHLRQNFPSSLITSSFHTKATFPTNLVLILLITRMKLGEV